MTMIIRSLQLLREEGVRWACLAAPADAFDLLERAGFMTGDNTTWPLAELEIILGPFRI